MFSARNPWFTIGEFAKLHEINKKTLMWYDEIGLLKPARIRDNGYRCYSLQQSARLETILLLRELQVSLPEIQEFLNHRSAATLEALLEEKIQGVDAMLARLQAMREVMVEKKEELSTLSHMDLEEISLVEKPEAHELITVPASPDTPLEEAIAMVVEETKKHSLKRLHNATYGSMLPVENLYGGRLADYTAFFIELPVPVRQKGLHIQPKGTYLRAFCQGNWDRLPGRYREILAYAKEHHLQFCGFAYEKGINELVIDSLDDYITQIEIPVRQDEWAADVQTVLR